MTIQQLQYIIAIDDHRNFGKAADECGVTQPTLSSMVKKLEDELDVTLFDRTNKYVKVTAIGNEIIKQARKVVMEAMRINEIINESKNEISGELRISVGPSIAPYILPKFIKIYGKAYPSVKLSVEEIRSETMLESLLITKTDIGIATAGLQRNGIYEIPLYTEPFWVYLSDDSLRRSQIFNPDDLAHESMWVMKEAQCLRDSAFSFCKAQETGKRIYEAGNIDTLIRIVDENGGFTIIPQMHLPFLDESQRKNVCRLDENFKSMRKISMYIRSDYVRETMLNTVVDTLAKFIPEDMLETSIRKYGIRL